MKGLFALLLLGLLAGPVAAQTTINKPLKRELDSMSTVDQKWRSMLFDPRISHHPDSLAVMLGVPRDKLFTYLNRRMLQADSTNQRRLRVIMKRHGYPGKTLVGEPTNEAAWYIIQHSDDIDRYLPLIKKAADKGELPFYLYGQMLDRQLMRAGKEQLYGTQAMGYNVTNPATKQREMQPPFIWPIKDAAQVNARRREAGFNNTVEQNAAQMGIPYRVLTLQDVGKMPKK